MLKICIYLDMCEISSTLWSHGVEQRRPHKCPSTLSSCELPSELPVSIDYRACVDGILDFLSLRIKISSCLPVWDAPCWPTCWVWCEMCVPPLWPYYPPAITHMHKLAALTVLICLASPHRPRSSSLLSPLFSARVFLLLSPAPLAKLSVCSYSTSSLSRHTPLTADSNANILLLLVFMQK